MRGHRSTVGQNGGRTPSTPVGRPVPGPDTAAMPHFTHRKELAMRRAIIILIGAGIAAVPAAVGLVGNASFAERLPVRVPASVTVTSGTHELGDDRGSLRVVTDDLASHDANDDKGGNRPRPASGEPATHEANDDKGGDRHRGSDDPATHDAGDDHGGSSGGHGSDG